MWNHEATFKHIVWQLYIHKAIPKSVRWYKILHQNHNISFCFLLWLLDPNLFLFASVQSLLQCLPPLLRLWQNSTDSSVKNRKTCCRVPDTPDILPPALSHELSVINLKSAQTHQVWWKSLPQSRPPVRLNIALDIEVLPHLSSFTIEKESRKVLRTPLGGAGSSADHHPGYLPLLPGRPWGKRCHHGAPPLPELLNWSDLLQCRTKGSLNLLQKQEAFAGHWVGTVSRATHLDIIPAPRTNWCWDGTDDFKKIKSVDVGVVQHLQDVNKWQDQGPLPNEACKWFEHPNSPLD